MTAPLRPDPRCPTCEGKVSATASSCMHCGATFEVPTDASVGSDGRRREADDAADHGDGRDARRKRSAWMDAEGPLDGTLTVAVGLVAGVVAGAGSALVFGSLSSHDVVFLLVLAAWLGVTVRVVRRPTFYGALREGCYAVALVLVFLPVVALTDAAKGGTFGGQVLLFLVGELVFGLVAALVAGVGYWAGGRRPARTDGTDTHSS